MFRITHNISCRVSPLTRVSKTSADSQSEKVSDFVAQFALGFDPKRPPENVVLYRSAVEAYRNNNYAEAKVFFSEAIIYAKKLKAPDSTISLYTKELESLEEFLQTAQKSSDSAKRIQWWKVVIASAGISSFVTSSFGKRTGLFSG